MSEVPFNARIQIQVGRDGESDRIIIDGRDVSLQTRSVEFVAMAGEVTDVCVTYASPEVTVEGLATVTEAAHG